MKCIGMDIGGSHYSIALIEVKNIKDIGTFKVLKEYKEIYGKTRKYGENFLNYIYFKIVEFAEESLKERLINSLEDILIIGINMPAKIEKNYIYNSCNLWIKNYDFNIFIEKFKKDEIFKNAKFILKNDIISIITYLTRKEKKLNLKECKYGILSFGTGIGCAFGTYNNLKTYEIGHSIIEKNGKKCNCGKNGCIEKYAAFSILKNYLKKEENINIYENVEKIQEILNRHEKFFNKYIDYVVIVLINFYEIFNPDIIYIAGGISDFKYIFNKVKEKLESKKFLSSNRLVQKEFEIKLVDISNDAEILGSILE